MYKDSQELIRALEQFRFSVIFSDEKLKGQKLCLFGFGVLARFIIESERDKVFCVIDNDSAKWGQTYKGVMIKPPNELAGRKDINVFISATNHMHDLYMQLQQLELPVSSSQERLFRLFRLVCSPAAALDASVYINLKEIYQDIPIDRLLTPIRGEIGNKILALYIIANKLPEAMIEDTMIYDYESNEIIFEICANTVWSIIGKPARDIFSPSQYFIPEIRAALTKDECFVDAGAYNGNTIETFLEHTNNVFEQIYAFEMDKANFNHLETYTSLKDDSIKQKIALFNTGLGAKNQTINYNPGGANSSVCAYGLQSARITRLDDALLNKRVTFIKMDIEGSETDALSGAAGIIKSQLPKLAIACYHTHRDGELTGQSDLFDVPRLIKSIAPQYQILLRHHTQGFDFTETICYALPPKCYTRE